MHLCGCGLGAGGPGCVEGARYVHILNSCLFVLQLVQELTQHFPQRAAGTDVEMKVI